MLPSNLLTSVYLFAATCLAWPSALLARETPQPALAVRATTYDLSYSATQGNTATTVAATVSDGVTIQPNTTSGTETSSPTYDARLPAGGVSMITPGVYDAATYHKIGTEANRNIMTFAYNYTSLRKNPSYVDILASCSLNSATYTISANLSFPTNGTLQTITWDTGAYQATGTVPLLTETYTLVIHDAAKDIDATPQSGYLGTWSQLTFGMYVGQEYTPLADWTCATCSGALSSMERQTLVFMFGMAVVTVLSFSWFTGAAGVW